jgi:hypothetical protein
MIPFLAARSRPAQGQTLVRFATVGWVLSLPTLQFLSPTSAQEPSQPHPSRKGALPGRIFVVSMIPGDSIEGLVAFDPNDRTWVRLVEGTNASGRVSPDGAKYMRGQPAKVHEWWVEDLRGEAKPVKIFAKGRDGRCCWSPDGREALISVSEERGAMEVVTPGAWPPTARRRRCCSGPFPRRLALSVSHP